MFEKVNIQDLKFNPFDEISNHWVLISAKKDGVVDEVLDSVDNRLSDCDFIILCSLRSS